MIQEQTKEELIKEIIIERLRNMSPNVKVSLGSSGQFLKRDELIKEVTEDTKLGKKIIKIQLAYIHSFKR